MVIYFVTEVISDDLLRIRKTQNSKSQVVHHDRLKPFYGEVVNWVKTVRDDDDDDDLKQ